MRNVIKLRFAPPTRRNLIAKDMLTSGLYRPKTIPSKLRYTRKNKSHASIREQV